MKRGERLFEVIRREDIVIVHEQGEVAESGAKTSPARMREAELGFMDETQAGRYDCGKFGERNGRRGCVIDEKNFPTVACKRLFVQSVKGSREADALIRLIVDPIDGTRGIMYDKRPAWTLAAVAPNRGPHTGLRDCEVSVMIELPTS